MRRGGVISRERCGADPGALVLMMVVVVMVVVVVGLEPTRATTRGRCLVGEFLVERLLLLEVLRYPARVRMRVRARVGVGVGVGVGAGVGVRVGVRVRVGAAALSSTRRRA